MAHDNDQGGFNVGDPVQLVGDPGRVGKVTVFTPPITHSQGKVCWPYVVFSDSPLAHSYYPASLRICKCATRIPKKESNGSS